LAYRELENTNESIRDLTNQYHRPYGLMYTPYFSRLLPSATWKADLITRSHQCDPHTMENGITRIREARQSSTNTSKPPRLKSRRDTSEPKPHTTTCLRMRRCSLVLLLLGISWAFLLVSVSCIKNEIKTVLTVREGTLNTAAGAYLGLRVLYTQLYINTTSRKVSFLRSLVWAISTGILFFVYVKAGNKALHEGWGAGLFAATAYCICLPVWKLLQKSLAVVNIAVIPSFCCIAMTCVYCARKYTIVGPYKCATKELAGKDTRVNVVAPQVNFFDSCD
jgi:hypothetical protein